MSESPSGAAASATLDPAHSAETGRSEGGEWEDVDPAVRFAAREHEMVVLKRSMDAPLREHAALLRYELLTVHDEPVVIHVQRGAPGDGGESGAALSITARIGRFGDEQRAAALIETVRARLEALDGRDVAPPED